MIISNVTINKLLIYLLQITFLVGCEDTAGGPQPTFWETME